MNVTPASVFRTQGISFKSQKLDEVEEVEAHAKKYLDTLKAQNPLDKVVESQEIVDFFNAQSAKEASEIAKANGGKTPFKACEGNIKIMYDQLCAQAIKLDLIKESYK